MTPRELKPGEIVQLSPHDTLDPMFAGAMMVISEPKAFGAQGYVQVLGTDGEPGGLAYYRATWIEMDETGGVAPWVIP